jgi:hypothetical protein
MAVVVMFYKVMVEAANSFKQYPTSILDVYKEFEHLEMLWMGIWMQMHPYAVLPMQVWMDFRKNGVSWLSLNDVVQGHG